MFQLVVRTGCTRGTCRTRRTAVCTSTTVGRRYSTGDHCSTGCSGLSRRHVTQYIGRSCKRRFYRRRPVAQHRQQGNCHHFLHINSFLTFNLIEIGHYVRGGRVQVREKCEQDPLFFHSLTQLIKVERQVYIYGLAKGMASVFSRRYLTT
ncbi:hypothetical protein EMIT0P74_140159 [Pseudomonas sp. IT-P74]